MCTLLHFVLYFLRISPHMNIYYLMTQKHTPQTGLTNDFFLLLSNSLLQKKPINLIRKQTDTLIVRCPLKKSLMVSQLSYYCIHSNNYSAFVQLKLCNLCSTTHDTF